MKLKLSERRQIEPGQRGRVERRERAEPAAVDADGEHFGGEGRRLAEEDHPVPVGAHLEIAVESSGNDPGAPHGGDVERVEVVIAPLLDLEHQGA